MAESQRRPISQQDYQNYVSLKEHFESRLLGIEQAVEVAHKAMESRLNSMNEFRDTLRDQASRFITRQEMDTKLDALRQEMNARLEAINKQLEDLKLSKAQLEGKASQTQANIILGISLFSLIISIVRMFIG